MGRSYKVGIVGFGMAGGLAAYLLARDGHQVTLLERADRLGPTGAGVLLQSSGQAILAQLGLLDAVVARAAPLDELHARFASGGDLIRTRYADYAPGCLAYGVHRGVLFNVLHDAVKTQPIEVRTGCEIVRREITSQGVRLHDRQGNVHGPFDFLLSGDGSRSQLRQAWGFPAAITNYHHGTLWLIAPGTTVQRKLLQVVEGTRRLFGLLPLGDGLSTLYWGLPVRDYPALRARGLPALKQEILAFSPEAAETLDFLYDMDQLLMTTYRHVHMTRWYDDHVLFFGDSAHAMSPHLGQGINLAMVDAYVLAECVRETGTPREAFARFRRLRADHIRYYAAVTYLLSPFFQSDWWLLGWGRDWALPLLPRIPFVKQQMLLTVSGQKGGFVKGRATWGPSPLPRNA